MNFRSILHRIIYLHRANYYLPNRQANRQVIFYRNFVSEVFAVEFDIFLRYKSGKAQVGSPCFVFFDYVDFHFTSNFWNMVIVESNL